MSICVVETEEVTDNKYRNADPGRGRGREGRGTHLEEIHAFREVEPRREGQRGNQEHWSTKTTKQTQWPLVRKRNISTERPPLVGEI
jgi:hypothetical protein